jgi:streptomycin 6-kinase
MITIPHDFAMAAITRAGDAGRTWLAELPLLIAAFCQEWQLVVDGAPLHGHLGLVVPVRRGAELCMLKVFWPDGSTDHEARALTAWNGQGAVHLLAAHAARGVLLLERLDSRQSLHQLAITDAVPLAAHLLRRLAVPAPTGLPILTAWVQHLVTTLRPRWEQLVQSQAGV